MDAYAEAPVSPKTYLPLDLPPRDEKPAMRADERLNLQKELIAARDRQESRAKAASSIHEALENESPDVWASRRCGLQMVSKTGSAGPPGAPAPIA
jgi:hypothetical protein